jgi:hypothetical protein
MSCQNPIQVTLVPTNNGLGYPSFNHNVGTTLVQVKGSASQVYGFYITSQTGAEVFLQVFDKLSANVTLGTTAPDYVIPVAAANSTIVGSYVYISIPYGIVHSTGITIAVTDTPTGNSNTVKFADVLVFTN